MTIVRTTVRLTFPGGDRAGTNTWHIRTGPGPGDVDLVAEAMAQLEDYYTAIKTAVWAAQFSATWDGEAVTVAAEPEALAHNDGWTVTGTGGGNPVAAGVGLVVGWRTNLASRRGRGRTFHCPVITAAFDQDGSLTPTTQSSVQAAADNLVSDSMDPNDWSFGVYSPTDNVIRDFTRALVADKVAFLSSRRD